MGEQGPDKARGDHEKEAVEKNLRSALCISITITFLNRKKILKNKSL